jgi:DNA-binding XRE family transcriptional regulator
MTTKDFGAKVKEERLKAGLTQIQLASALRTHKQCISSIENGNRETSKELKAKIMSIFNIDYQEVATFIDKKAEIK